jgi:hypothetical protein
VAGATECQFRFVLLLRLLLVAIKTATVHGIFIGGREHTESSLSFFSHHRFVTILANRPSQIDMLFLRMAFLAAIIPAQSLLVDAMVED